eukprot:3345134-Ditylum_brightwellii.AAC.1
MAESMRTEDGRPIALVWAPWDNVSTMNPVEFSRPDQGTKALKDLNWRGARELLNNAYFGHNGKKGASNNTRRTCNIRILFDSMEEDKSRVKQQFSDELRNIDSRNQVWLSILQTSTNSTRVGQIFYSAPNFDVSPILQ